MHSSPKAQSVQFSLHSTPEYTLARSIRKKVLASWLSVENEHGETCDSILVTNHQVANLLLEWLRKKVPGAKHREKVNVVM